ncbi:MAG: hypothetical protein M3O67_07720 [Bacteroidota bacterium]|nr:hypothetical protein [Bacteroidota bacterium]
MDEEKFEILVSKWGEEKRQIYRMQVEVIYHSEQVIRFKVSAGDKFMIMEKLLIKKTGQWKIKE